MYKKAELVAEQQLSLSAEHINPRSVFVNNELNLHKINTYGFDYDYTLAVYKRELNELVYGLAMKRLIIEMKVY